MPGYRRWRPVRWSCCRQDSFRTCSGSGKRTQCCDRVAVAGGTPPDVAELYTFILYNYVEKGRSWTWRPGTACRRRTIFRYISNRAGAGEICDRCRAQAAQGKKERSQAAHEFTPEWYHQTQCQLKARSPGSSTRRTFTSLKTIGMCNSCLEACHLPSGVSATIRPLAPRQIGRPQNSTRATIRSSVESPNT